MLYFRGCTAREKETGIAEATEKLLGLANVDYHILDDEKCCGSVLLRTGFEDEAKKQIAKNTEVFGDETILTSCAGCYKTLLQDYEGLDVIHISELLAILIDEGRLKFNKKDLDVTYHDSCHLGRHLDESIGFRYRYRFRLFVRNNFHPRSYFRPDRRTWFIDGSYPGVCCWHNTKCYVKTVTLLPKHSTKL